MTKDRKPPHDTGDETLDALLGGYASDARPHPNDRKIAINLALAAFDEAQTSAQTQQAENKDKSFFQGIPFLSRLTSRPNREKGSPHMSTQSKWKPAYGIVGMLAVVAIAGAAAITTTGENSTQPLFSSVSESLTSASGNRSGGNGPLINPENTLAQSTELAQSGNQGSQQRISAPPPPVATSDMPEPHADTSMFGSGMARAEIEAPAESFDDRFNRAGRDAVTIGDAAPMTIARADTDQAEDLSNATQEEMISRQSNVEHEAMMLRKQIEVLELRGQLKRAERDRRQTEAEIRELAEAQRPNQDRLAAAASRELTENPDKAVALQDLSVGPDGSVSSLNPNIAAGAAQGLFGDLSVKPTENPAAPAPMGFANNNLMDDQETFSSALPEPQIMAAAPPPPVPAGTPSLLRQAETRSRVAEMDRLREAYREGRLQRFSRPEPRPVESATWDRFQSFADYQMTRTDTNPVSTFSVDVDTASYAMIRRQILREGRLPQRDSVRVEEMVNYFDYHYAKPMSRDVPFATTVAVTGSPWAAGRKLMHIGIKGYDLPETERPRANLTFLIDVSGSMRNSDKLPLLKRSFIRMLDALHPEDRVGIVVYAGAAGVVLEPTEVANKGQIITALNNLRAGGSTAGAAGIEQAYTLARAVYDSDAVNRVILATDGDFNVGISNHDQLKSYIETQRDSGISLSVLGFGMGNLNDQLMQTLAQNGNGNAAFIDSDEEAEKVLVEQAGATLFTIAKDVKIQIEFNPATVQDYRLIGYETRALARQDFDNDRIDAGEIGAGHSVTAIYEITPVGAMTSANAADTTLRYTPRAMSVSDAAASRTDEYAFLKIRYKQPDEDRSQLITRAISAEDEALLFDPCNGREDCSKAEYPVARNDIGFATAVAGFGQMLRGARATSGFGFRDVADLARAHAADDPRRQSFVRIVERAAELAGE
ncbi:MAG: hypothetical protein Alpg2KO_33180 [Alphaproteobacteria bacterium]